MVLLIQKRRHRDVIASQTKLDAAGQDTARSLFGRAASCGPDRRAAGAAAENRKPCISAQPRSLRYELINTLLEAGLKPTNYGIGWAPTPTPTPTRR